MRKMTHGDIRQLIIFHLQEVTEQEEVTKQSTSKDLAHTCNHSEILSPLPCSNNTFLLFNKKKDRNCPIHVSDASPKGVKYCIFLAFHLPPMPFDQVSNEVYLHTSLGRIPYFQKLRQMWYQTLCLLSPKLKPGHLVSANANYRIIHNGVPVFLHF